MTAILFSLAMPAIHIKGISIATPLKKPVEVVKSRKAITETWYRKNVLKLDS
jgi:hypothetical protein